MRNTFLDSLLWQGGGGILALYNPLDDQILLIDFQPFFIQERELIKTVVEGRNIYEYEKLFVTKL